ncbi:hypothetical protein LYSHEL_29550 [Lysobacter helvus]|nr:MULTISPECIES: DcaP family trimeric outer membrane transporter [Lysobacter]BCT97084.1 hypothetical protein LYSHEL_29550 [Lysobacter helvus]
MKLHLLGVALAAAIAPGVAAAQSKDATTAELKEQIAKMQAQLQQQQQAMQQMQQRLSELETTQQAQAAAAPTVAPAVAAAAQPVTDADIPQQEPASRIHKPPSALAGVEEPPPSGYVRLGDSGNMVKLDVVAQTDMMFDNKLMPYKDLFIPAGIPVEGQPFHDSHMQSNLSAKQSVVRMDFRRDTPYGLLKVVYKNNFFGFGGPDMDYNLQYLYGELEAKDYSILAGYYLSGFTDISVFPNTLDYEGPNSFTFKYAPQFRYTPVIWRHGEGRLTLPMTLEKPNADIALISDNQTYSKYPDVTLGLRYEAPDWHIQWSNLFRNLAVQSASSDRTRSTEAYATQLTFAAGVFGDDSVQGWVSTGKGYANFLQDITGFGLDAAFNPSLDLEATDAYAWGMGYTHAWSDAVSSSASYGYLNINPDFNVFIDQSLPDTTQYASLNVAWQFSERAMVGAEWLWGHNKTLAGDTGDAQRLQMTFRYDLNP